MITKLFNFIKSHQADTILAIAIVLITITSYNLGRISAFQSMKQSGAVVNDTQAADNIVRRDAGQGSVVEVISQPRDPTVVVSKKSKSKLYHFLDCPGAKNITIANRLTFPDEAAAIAAGYTLAGNCQK